MAFASLDDFKDRCHDSVHDLSELDDLWVVSLLLILRAVVKNAEGFVDDRSDDAATVESRLGVRAVEHYMEEVGALVIDEHSLQPLAEH